jgi:hypothetical protein
VVHYVAATDLLEFGSDGKNLRPHDDTEKIAKIKLGAVESRLAFAVNENTKKSLGWHEWVNLRLEIEDTRELEVLWSGK